MDGYLKDVACGDTGMDIICLSHIFNDLRLMLAMSSFCNLQLAQSMILEKSLWRLFLKFYVVLEKFHFNRNIYTQSRVVTHLLTSKCLEKGNKER
jgi:hypothetical protein